MRAARDSLWQTESRSLGWLAMISLTRCSFPVLVNICAQPERLDCATGYPSRHLIRPALTGFKVHNSPIFSDIPLWRALLADFVWFWTDFSSRIQTSAVQLMSNSLIHHWAVNHQHQVPASQPRHGRPFGAMSCGGHISPALCIWLVVVQRTSSLVRPERKV
jgi:hypothetical protein